MPRRKNKIPKVRLNLEVTEAVRDRLENLQEVSEADSMTEVVRRALTVYELVVKTDRDGGRVVLEKSDGEAVQLALA